MNKRTLIGLTVLLVTLLAGPAVSSNTGYKVNYHLNTGGRNLVSLPYFYYPSGIFTETQNALHMCDDLSKGGCAVITLVRFIKDGSTLRPFTQPCASPLSLFDFTPGEALFVNVGGDCVADFIGSADDDYNLGGSKFIELTAGNNNISIPYHVQANNSMDLCRDIEENNPGPGLRTLVKVLPSGLPFTFTCGAPAGEFDLEPGEGLFIVPDVVDPDTYDIQWLTY